jgi:GGDEF domain-containing protein
MATTTLPPSTNEFGTELGDVYLSILSVLSKESEQPGVQAISTKLATRAPVAPERPAPERPAPEPTPARDYLSELRQRAAAGRSLAVRSPAQPPAIRPDPMERLRDGVTGAGNWEALRRDVMMETAHPKYRAPFVLVSFAIEPLDQIRRESGPAVADTVLRTLVHVMWAVFNDDDRVYRSGDKELTVVVRDGDGFFAQRILSKLEKAVHQALARRNLPAVRMRLTASRAAMAAFDVTGLGAVL